MCVKGQGLCLTQNRSPRRALSFPQSATELWNASQNQGAYQLYFDNLLRTGEFHEVLGCRTTEQYPYPQYLSFHVPNVEQAFVHVGEFRDGKRRTRPQTFPCISF